MSSPNSWKNLELQEVTHSNIQMLLSSSEERALRSSEHRLTNDSFFLSFFGGRSWRCFLLFQTKEWLKKKKIILRSEQLTVPALFSLSLTGFPRTSLTLTCITASFHLPSLTSFNWRINLSTFFYHLLLHELPGCPRIHTIMHLIA